MHNTDHRPQRRRALAILLSAILMVGFLTYAVCLFKHISYPLMWADESMTAVGAQRVIEYGYPKVHDGRNVFYDLRHDDLTLGIDKKTDAYIGGAGWAPYYFTAPFVVISRLAPDLYHKTAILRIPFALAGFAGLLLLLWIGTRPLETRLNRLAAAVLFVALELPCVTLMLHLREVRYYSLQLLLTTVALSAFAAYHLRSSIKYRTYAVTMVCLIPLLFLTFSPASAAFCVTVGIYLGGEWIISAMKARQSRISPLLKQLKPLTPVLVSLILVAPLAWFFRTLYISRKLEEFYHFSSSIYLEHLTVVAGYFAKFDIIVFAVIAKLILILLWRRLRSNAALIPAVKMSLLLSVYFVTHALLIGKIPHLLFTRYFITLQPILVMTFALDLLILARILLCMNAGRKAACVVMTMFLAGSIGWSYSQNWPLIKGRLYEIRHQYKGVLDFVIPYIQKRYEHPEKLVVATNYEETSYIYYLGSKVIVGFLNPDFRPDRLEQPDCIVFRSVWANPASIDTFNGFISRAAYEMVRFPVLDYMFNNIPETMNWTPETGWDRRLHLFETAYTNDPRDQATLLLRRNDSRQP